MKARYYFYTEDSEMCYTLSAIKEQMREDGITKTRIYFAQPLKDKSFFFCREFEAVGEVGDGFSSCGKSCEGYEPRNGKFGICKHYGKTYEPTGKSRIVNVKKEPVTVIMEK